LLPAGAQCPVPDVISRAVYAQFLDWLKAEVDAGRVQVKTVHDVIGGPLAPQVVVDPVPVRAGNLLLNPSYEQSSTAGGPSSCWANISNGPDSPPTITTTTDAHEGAKALAISVPATYDSWAYNLIAPVLDLGQCAPTAIAGHRYTFTGWYKGNGQIRIVAYWRNADNQWTRVDWGTAGTATLPAATAWTKGTLAFLAPAGATAVSAGFYVDGTAVNRSAGNSYTIDDTSLVDDDAGQLSVATSGTGSGTVSSSPAGIDCGAACQFTFVNGATVTLTAAPAAGSGFTSWSGACSGASAACVVTTNAAKSVTATFTLLPVQLGVVKAGSGSGTVTSSPAGIACGSTCQATFVNGTTVTLTAAPSVDSTFTGWSGACAGAATQCVVSMSAARSVTATFTVKALLQVMRTGTGTGAVSGSAGGIACGATCQASFANGTTVTLTAVAAPGSSFAAWSGACSGTATTCSLDMTSDRTATATFTANAALAVAGAGSGTGVVAGDGASGIDCGGVCNAQLINGSTVTLAAVAAPGSTFLGWSGACSGTSAICTLLMTADRIAIASFALNPPPAPVVATAPVVPAVTPAVIPAVAPPVIVARVSARPVARVRPKVSGSARVRRTLVCTRGSWTGSPTRYVFTWRRDGKVVIAHGSAYHVRPADRGHGIRCEVTAVNAKGSTTASSGALHIAV
ncbi:MAG: trimeric autotransporter adhesin, partial [Gaiellales bacterium]|nr:trimeric autotransporter adhesin [Gaiellales bacterium]